MPYVGILEMTAGLDRGLLTARSILGDADLLMRELRALSAGGRTRSLRAVSDRLVAQLLPELDAEEAVAAERLEPALSTALSADHRAVRAVTERLEVVADAGERRRGRGGRWDVEERALGEATAILKSLAAHQETALRQLEAMLSEPERERLADRLLAAAAVARKRMMLVVSPAVPSTASTVLRKRPDLDAARAVSLDDIERTMHTGGG